MTSISQIVPGKVNNRGINDKSIPDYVTEPATFPLFLPVVNVITPKGDFGTKYISLKDFQKVYGDIFDHKSPYYTPTSKLIEALASGGLSAIGVRRLSVNKSVARICLAAHVTKVKVKQFERDYTGQYKLDANGDRVPKLPDLDGIDVRVMLTTIKANAGDNPGDMQIYQIPAVSPATTPTVVYPLFELIAGVGDVYNLNGVNLGVTNNSASRKSIQRFVEDTGVYPFFMRQFMDDAEGGPRTYVKDRFGSDMNQFTLYEVENQDVKYSLRECIGNYTGGNINRKVTLRPAPFGDCVVYQDSIDQLMQLMYAVEKPYNTGLVDGHTLPFRQMNPFTLVDHKGIPYYGISGQDFNIWDMSYRIHAQFGISPFHDEDDKLPDYVTVPTVDDPFGLLANVKYPLTHRQAWEITNKLMAADITEFVGSLEQNNYVMNRQSVFIDVGYEYPVKEAMMSVLGARKDIMVMGCATIFNEGIMNPLSAVYGRFSQLTAGLRMFAESEYWGTQSARGLVNLIEAKVIDEATGWYFSGNIDLAYQFARFAGAENGTLKAAASPDHGDNRLLTLMHSPNIEFEDDEIASNNFDGGGVTLRPYDITGALFRPCIPTVYKASVDSVLKDAVTVFTCICLEKIGQDEFNVVCGDTRLSSENYAALVKDGIERKSRDRLGGIVRTVNVETGYTENQPGGRAILNTVIHAYFNKAKYMMNLDLFAYNEQDLQA